MYLPPYPSVEFIISNGQSMGMIPIDPEMSYLLSLLLISRLPKVFPVTRRLKSWLCVTKLIACLTSWLTCADVVWATARKPRKLPGNYHSSYCVFYVYIAHLSQTLKHRMNANLITCSHMKVKMNMFVFDEQLPSLTHFYFPPRKKRKL